VDGVRISVEAGGDPRDRAEATQRLARELLRARLNVRSVGDVVPDGAKSGTAAAIGEMVASGVLSAAGLKALSSVVIAFVNRGGARKVTLTHDGDEITLEGLSSKAQQQVVEDWISRRVGQSD
jgi:hypothetical protein